MSNETNAHPMNEPGAILAELNALRKLVGEVTARLKRDRKRTREAAEMLDAIRKDVESAYAKHLTGANDEALAVLRSDIDTDDEDAVRRGAGAAATREGSRAARRGRCGRRGFHRPGRAR